MTRKRDWLGALIGLAVFLGGIGIIVWAFRQAYTMFTTPPSDALGIKSGETVNLNRAGENGIRILYQTALLFVIVIIGSVVANRGIKLYSESQRLPASSDES